MSAPLLFAAGLNYLNKRSAADNAGRKKAEWQQWDDKASQNIRDIITKAAGQYDPATRKANLQGIQTATEQRLNQDVANAGGNQVNPQTGGKVSDAYTTTRARRVADNARVAETMARLMSKVRSHSDLRGDEGLNNASSGLDANVISANRSTMSRSAMSDINQAAQPDAGVDLIAAMLSGYGKGSMQDNATAGRRPAYFNQSGPVYSGPNGPFIPRSYFQD